MGRQKLVSKIIASIILIGAIVAAILMFFVQNKARIVSQNADYISGTNEKSVARINDLLNSTLDSLETISFIYGRSLEYDELDTNDVLDLFDHVPFLNVYSVNSKGVTKSIDGSQEIDVSDRFFFIDGMKGHSGAVAVIESRLSPGSALDFYTPVYVEDKIVGVLVGVTGEDELEKLIASELFGYSAITTLINDQGEILVSTNHKNEDSNYFRYLEQSGYIKKADIEDLKNAAENDHPYVFKSEGLGGDPFALSMLPTEFDNLLLIQVFPPEVAKSMIAHANSAGRNLEIILVGVFLLYCLYLVISYNQTNKKLRKEKEVAVIEAEEVSAISELYSTCLNGVARSYVAIYYIRVPENHYVMVYPEDGDDKEEGSFNEAVRNKVENSIMIASAEQDKEELIKNLQLDSLLDFLKDRDSVEFRYRRVIEGSGNIEWCLSAVTCVKRDENGIPVNLVMSVRSIDDIMKKEIAQRQFIKSALERAEAESAAKTKFLSSMSHDIRTPMNAITGMTTIATMHIDDKERVKDCLNKITISSRHLLNLINEVLDMSKIESGKVVLNQEEMNIPSEIEALLSIFRGEMKKKNILMHTNLVKIEHEDAIGDPVRLQQILVNILGNAIKFTPVDGTITLDIKEKPTRQPGYSEYDFIIADTGIGMSEDFIKVAFEPFKREESSTGVRRIEGTGLGLSIAYNLAKMMGGDIKIKSVLGKGSEFTIQVILKIPEAVAPIDYTSLVSLSVLIVDDDKDTCEYEMELLDSVGMVGEYVLDGREAVRRVVERHNENKDFSVVVLDWLMPGQDGIETARQIREQVGHELPIIFLTTYDWAEIEADARKAGINAFISKPLFKSRFLGAMKTALRDENVEIPGIQLKRVENFEKTNTNFVGHRILLAEDNDLNAEIAIELLTSVGFIVDRAENGKEAHRMLVESPVDTYNLVLMDIQMPIMNGYEATVKIRAEERMDLKKIPIVAMSADTFKEDIDKARASGMNNHVGKPIELDKLYKILEQFG